jgi:hypothetical protein
VRGEGWGLRYLGQVDFRVLEGGLDKWIATNGNEGERALAGVLRARGRSSWPIMILSGLAGTGDGCQEFSGLWQG